MNTYYTLLLSGPFLTLSSVLILRHYLKTRVYIYTDLAHLYSNDSLT